MSTQRHILRPVDAIAEPLMNEDGEVTLPEHMVPVPKMWALTPDVVRPLMHMSLRADAVVQPSVDMHVEVTKL